MLEVQKQEVRLEQLREQHRMQTERAAASIDKQTASQERLNVAMRTHVTDVQAASASIRAFEGNLPIRAVEQFTTKILGLGPAMQAAFPIVGAIALVEALDRGGEKLLEHIFHWKEIKKLEEDATKQVEKYADASKTALERLRALQQENYTRQNGPLAGAVRNAQQTAIDANSATAAAATTERRLAAVRNILAFERSIPTGHPSAVPSQEDLLYAGQVGFNLVDSFQEQNDPRKIPQLKGPVLAGLEKKERELAEALIAARNEAAVKSEAATGAQFDVRDELKRQADEAERKRQEAQRLVESAQRKLEELDRRLEVLYNAEDSIYGRFVRNRAELMRAGADELTATNAAGHAAAVELGKGEKEAEKRNFEMALKASHSAAQEWEDVYKTFEKISDRAVKNAQEFIRAARELRYDSTQRTFGLMGAVADHQVRMLNINSLPGDDLKTLREQIKVERSYAEEEYKIKAENADIYDMAAARHQLEITNLKAELELIEKRAELERQQREEFARNVVGFVHAAASGNAGGFIKGRLSSIGDEILGKIAAKIFDEMAKARAANQKVPWKDMGIGLGGQDPVVASNDRVVDADNRLIDALDRVSFWVSRMGGPAAVAGQYPVGTIGFPNGSNGPGVMGTSNSAILFGFPGTNTPSPLGNVGNLGSRARFGAGVAAAGLGYEGITTITHGGARNVIGGSGELAGAASFALMAAGVAGPAAPILAGVGLALGVISSLLGDPKAARQQQINNSLTFGRYIDPVAINASMTTFGGYADYDRFGGVRGSGLSPFPITQAGYRDPFNGNSIVPGRTVSPFGGGPAVTVNVQAMDAKSIVDRHQDIGDAVLLAIDAGHIALQEKIRSL